MTSEAPSTRDELSARQLERLRELCRVQLESNPFYGPRLRSAGLTGQPDSIEAFTSRCPLTAKQDFREDRAANPPYGSNLSRPIEDYVRLHQTSSTTGEPVRWIDTREDWDAMLDGWIEVLEAAGLTRADRVFGAASFGPFIGFWLGFEAAEKMGCLVIPGGAMTTSTRVRAILANDVTTVLCTPTYAIRLGETARVEGIDLGRGAVRRLIVAGEPGGSIPAVRERIERLWPGAAVFDHHGMTECGPATYECPNRPGVLHLIERNLLCEFVDPSTGESVPDPRADDEAHSRPPCELVLTSLRRAASPILRYRTGDLVRPGPVGKCACGRIERTLLGGIIARADDMVFIRGVNLYPSAVDDVVQRIDGVSEYRVLIAESRGMTELSVEVECEKQDRERTIAHRLTEDLRSGFGLRIPVTPVPPGSLPKAELKSRRWVRVTGTASGGGGA